jgi:SAM-dependent methyltransferase
MASNAKDVFASGAYWREYYSSLGHENREVGAFLAELTRAISPDGGLKMLDAGCGPALLYWAVFVAGRNDLYGFDLKHTNIADNYRQIKSARAGTMDSGLLEAARHALDVFGSTQAPEQLVADKAHQVIDLDVADLSQPWPYAAGKFDLVQSCFAMEALPDWDAFGRAVAEAHLVLKSGGSLVLASSAHSNEWICDGQHIKTLFMAVEDVRWHLADAGFSVKSLRDIQSLDVSCRDQGYNHLLLAHAVKA